MYISPSERIVRNNKVLFKAPIMTAADDIQEYVFIVFQRKQDLMFQVNPLLGRGFT